MGEVVGVLARVSVRAFGDAVVFAAVWAVFAAAATVGWRHRWLRHVSMFGRHHDERIEGR